TCKMKLRKQHILLLWILICSGVTEGIDPITGFIITHASTIATMYPMKTFYDLIHAPSDLLTESCDPQWISFNQKGLKDDLKKKLFGQHIASEIIFKAVNGFMSNKNPKKPLVLSLHGPTGTGKSFVSQLIADNIYKKGMDSQFVHMISATHHFPHQDQIATYKSQLQDWIKGNVTNCERSMFIFDQMDKILPGVIDGIEPFLDFYPQLGGVSFQKSIFIFLSNAGADIITQTALDFWNKERDREEIKLKHLEASLLQSVLNGFLPSVLIDIFIPFLPMEYIHVAQCVRAELKARGLHTSRALESKVALKLINFLQPGSIFSKNGCKTVGSTLHFYT
uniref:Torsin family 1 n=1 Tax=Amphilophus citrinellus TaxID=61819 RepID=A0A3Q0R5J5_AMPCI